MKFIVGYWELRLVFASNKHEKNANQKAPSPSFLISYCIKKRKVQGSLCSCHVFFKLAWYPVKVVASCGSIILACFALNSVEAQECIASSDIFGRKAEKYACDIKFSSLVNVFLLQFKVHRCSPLFLYLSQKHSRAHTFRFDFLIKKCRKTKWNLYHFYL